MKWPSHVMSKSAIPTTPLLEIMPQLLYANSAPTDLGNDLISSIISIAEQISNLRPTIQDARERHVRTHSRFLSTPFPHVEVGYSQPSALVYSPQHDLVLEANSWVVVFLEYDNDDEFAKPRSSGVSCHAGIFHRLEHIKAGLEAVEVLPTPEISEQLVAVRHQLQTAFRIAIAQKTYGG